MSHGCSRVHSAILRHFCQSTGTDGRDICHRSRCFVAVLLWMFSVSHAAAQTHPQSAPKLVRAEYRLDENAASGTVVATLVRKFPDLSNFRLTKDNKSVAFSVENASGRIAVRDGAVLDFEARSLHTFAIEADVNSAKEDPFFQQFAGTLLEEGITSGHLNQLLRTTRIITVHIRLRNADEPRAVPVAAEPTTADPPAMTTPSGIDSSFISSVDSAVSAAPDAQDIETTDAPDVATVIEEPAALEPLIAGPTNADVPREPIEELGADPQSSTSGVPNDAVVALNPTELRKRSQSARSSGVSDTTDSVSPESGKTMPASTYVRDLIVVILILSVPGFIYFRVSRQAAEARQKALKEKEADEANRRLGAAATPEATDVEIPEETHFPTDAAAVHPENNIESDDKPRHDDSTWDVESLITADYFTETESVAGFTPANIAPPEVVRQLQLQIVERDTMIFDLKDQLEMVRNLLETVASPQESDHRFRDDSGYVTHRSMEVNSDEPGEPVKAAVQSSVAVADADPAPADPADREPIANNRSSEETHMDSVAQYLSQLLERSNKAEGDEVIFVDRRKSNSQWDGTDRRTRSKPAQPVKSYIESYLTEHGGQLYQDMADLQSLQQATKAPAPDEMPRVPVVRTPVDVRTIREHMNSFREVAFRSVDNALASYNQRQAKNKLVWRSALVFGLVIVTIMVVVSNATNAIQFDSLNWLMGIAVLLTAAELCLRAQSIRRHRKAQRLHLLEPQHKAECAAKCVIGEVQESPFPAPLEQSPLELGNSKDRRPDPLVLSLS